MRLDVAWVVATAVLLFGDCYRFEDLLGYVPDDAYQSLADAFRAGRLAVVADSDRVFLNTAPVGDDAYVVWGPFPAVVYAALDTVFDLVGLPAFPKMLLYVATAGAHLYLMILLVRRFLSDREWWPRLLVACYAFSYPFWYAAHENTRVNWVSILAASTLFLAGLHRLVCSRDEPHRMAAHLAWAGVFLSLAFLTRVVYVLHLAVMCLANLVHRKLSRPTAAFLIPMTLGVLAFLAYNFIRFGDPFQFGDALIYQINWDEEVTAKGVLPWDPLRVFARWGEALFAFLGAPEPPWSGSLDTLYRFHRTCVGVLLIPILFAIGTSVRRWVREYRTHTFELALVGVGVAVTLFYILYMDEFEIRYQMDLIPALWLAGVRAAEDAARRRSPWLVGPASLAVVVGFLALHLGLRSFIIEEHRIQEPVVLRVPHRMGVQIPGMWFFSGEDVDPEIRCEQIRVVRPSAEDFQHRQDSLKVLGIYRVSADRCEMAFFSGGVLKIPPDRRCRIDLTLDAAGVPECHRITLFRDGRRVGPMTETPSSRTEERVCSFPLGVTAERLVQAYFLFEPVPRRSRDWLRQTPRYGMKRLAAVCDDE